MNKLKTIQEADLKYKKVLLRADFNVPIKDGEIQSDNRIKEALPTIKYILKNGAAKITIITHLGKPEGKKEEKYSLAPVANCLAKLLSIDKKFDGPFDAYEISENITLLENLRFNPGEEANDPEFAKELAEGQDIFINDAFGTCHRAHASTSKVAAVLPSYAGLLVQKEVENLDKLLNSKEAPFTLILGGAKIADKLPLIKNLITRADNFLIGGAIANTFLSARRHYLGKSLVEEESFREANIIHQDLLDEPDRNLYLPMDLKVSNSMENSSNEKIILTADLQSPDFIKDSAVVDIGPETIRLYQEVIKKSKRIFWNGNMGVSEVAEFSDGTKAMADAITSSDAFSVVGGGDTVGYLEKVNLTDKFTFCSTGGGATLEYIAGKVLPGLKALE